MGEIPGCVKYTELGSETARGSAAMGWVPAPGLRKSCRWRQEDQEFKISLSYMSSRLAWVTRDPLSKTKQNKTKPGKKKRACFRMLLVT